MFVTGRLSLVALALIPVVGARPQVSTVLAVLAGIALLVAVDVARAIPIGSLRFSRSGTTSLRLGDSGAVELLLTLDSARGARVALRDAWLPSAGARPDRHRTQVVESATFITVLRPERRGDHHPDRITVRTFGPLGLAGRQGTHRSPWSVRVLPAFPSRKHLPSRLSRLQELEGRTPVMVRGAGTEFDTLRPYVEGDDVRSIDWRATARAPEVMVRTWRPERDRRIVIVLDSGRTSAARIGDAPRLDAAMDATLLLAALAGRAGDHVSMLVHDAKPRAWVSGAEGSDVLPSIVDALTMTLPALAETDARSIASTVLARFRQRALVVILTALDAEPMRAGLLPVIPLLTARHQVVIAAVSDPRITDMRLDRDNVDAAYLAASAERADRERRGIEDLMMRRGVEVVQAPPELIGPALADRYLALKAAGRL